VEFKVKGNTIELPSGKSVAFEYPISEAIEVDGVFVVRLRVPVDPMLNENVCAVDSDGCSLWCVPPIGPLLERSRFVRIGNAGSLVRLINVDGKTFDLEARSGNVVSAYYRR